MFFDFIVNLLFPNVCGICEKRIKYDSYTCENCASILKCCRERILKGNDYYFDEVISLFEYSRGN